MVAEEEEKEVEDVLGFIGQAFIFLYSGRNSARRVQASKNTSHHICLVSSSSTEDVGDAV